MDKISKSIDDAGHAVHDVDVDVPNDGHVHLHLHEDGAEVPDPSALGLFGLAMVTLVASTQKMGLTDGVGLVLPWAIFLGSFAQLFACVYDAKKNNCFGMTAFGAYGLFWLGIGTTWLIQGGVFGEELALQADIRQLGVAFLGYFIFTVFMTIGAAKTHKVLFTIFILICFLFFFLALHSFAFLAANYASQLSHVTGVAAGVTEMLIAIMSFYGSAAAILNIHYKRIVLPVGTPINIFAHKAN